jgi:hypothetical protein
VFAVIALSCKDSTAPATIVDRDADAFFQTDSLSYALHESFNVWLGAIGIEFANRTDKPVSFPNCNGALAVALQQRTGDDWQSVWENAVPECLSAPITVAPGAVFRDTVHIGITLAGSGTAPSALRSQLTGELRLLWYSVVHDYADGTAGFGTMLPVEQRISNRFTLRIR